MWDVLLQVVYGAAAGVGVLLGVGLFRMITATKDTTNAESLVKLEERNEIGRRQLAALEGIWGELSRVRLDADMAIDKWDEQDDHSELGGEAGGA
jgi:hypothetical protein